MNSNEYRPISTLTSKYSLEMFVAIGVTDGNEHTGGRPYVTDPYCVWQRHDGSFARWPHKWGPTHWAPLPILPEWPSPVDSPPEV